VAASPDRIIWADQLDGTINEAPLTGGGRPDTLIHGQDSPTGVAVDSGHIYWADQGRPGQLISGTIMQANLDGSGVTTLVSGQPAPWGVAVDGNHIYWANYAGGTIDEAPLAGGTVTTLVPTASRRPASPGWRRALASCSERTR
jgi:DNA-binding beta-propeller fold protein YncE